MRHLEDLVTPCVTLATVLIICFVSKNTSNATQLPVNTTIAEILTDTESDRAINATDKEEETPPVK